MSLEQEIEDLKKQIAEAESEPEVVEESEKDEEGLVDGDSVEDAAREEPEKTEEKVEEPVKEEAKAEDLDASGYARLRRDKKALEDKAERLARELEELKSAPKAEAKEEEKLPPVMREIVEDHTRIRAQEELTTFAAEAMAKHPDYAEVVAPYVKSVEASIRLLNPGKSSVEVSKLTEKHMLEMAGSYLNQGYSNPAEEIFLRAKEMGFRAQKEEKKETEVKVEPKPDMAKLAANRARSAGTAAAGGESKGQLTKQAAADLTVQEWQNLNPEEKRRLLYG